MSRGVAVGEGYGHPGQKNPRGSKIGIKKEWFFALNEFKITQPNIMKFNEAILIF
jgi:hypothetical protein